MAGGSSASHAPASTGSIGGGGGSRVHVSKTLTYYLRHNADKAGLHMDEEGYVAVDELQTLRALRTVTVDEMQDITRTCSKQRFAMRQVDGRWFIRANQGHSLASVSAEAMMARISDPAAHPIVVHGTTRAAWASIRSTGLNRMTRQHVHFAQGLPGQDHVVSGMRSSSQIMIYLNLPRALADGLPFFLSTNGVILSPGVGTTGTVPMEYFARVVDSFSGEQIYPAST